MAFIGFGGGGEDGFVEFAGHFVTGAQGHAADGAGLLVFFPAGADQVAAHNALNGEQFCLFNEHGTAFKKFFVLLKFCWKIFNIGGDHVVFNHITGAVEPEFGNHIQHLALVGDAVGHDAIEGRNAVGGYEEVLVAKVVHFTNLAGLKFFDAWKFN